MSFNTSPPPSRKGLVLGILVVIVIVTVGVVYAMFSQTLPSVTIPGQPGLTPNCGTLIQEGSVTPQSGVLLVGCGSPKPAFNVTGPFQATPSFSIPTNPTTVTTSLGITTAGSCSSFQTLTNNTALNLNTGSYDYCLSYSNVPASGGTIGPVTIAWKP